MGQQRFAAHGLAGFEHHNQQWALVPLRVGDTQHGGFGDRRVGHGDVFQVDRADPLATGLDHILGAVGDLHEAVRVEGGDIPGGEPAIDQRAGLDAEVPLDHPVATHQQGACGLAVTQQLVAMLVHDFQVRAERRSPLLYADGEASFVFQVEVRGLGRVHRAHRRQLGHAPGVLQADAELLLVTAHHRRWAGGATDDHAAQAGKAAPVLAHMLLQAQPHGGHASGESDALALEECEQALAVQAGAWKHQLGAHQWCGIGQAPGVDVEHGDHRGDDLAGRQCQRVRKGAGQCMQQSSAM
ncbi:hypothetical protein WR25_15958 [Diploscapter pachys]|uniref:Uncharacterized protein n=1 Tax=Diploscapter pachys TaxID=2018661 RepID=A0A2A2KEK6_9BILA|nr:hypothetical protein WR25_15958 [Diploscapter pachys]